MKKNILPLALSVAAVVFSPLRADAQSTYTTTNGTVNLVAGLTNLSSATMINPANQSVGIDYITDGSWSTGIFNLGFDESTTPGFPIIGGTLAGTFGGSNYFAASHSIMLIGVGAAGANAWGGWTVRLLLSDDSYSSAISYTDSDLINNFGVETDGSPWFFNNFGTTTANPAAVIKSTFYQELDIAAFDTGNIGVKGIELSNPTVEYPDIFYIGVATPVPEPSTYALLALSVAGLGGYVLRGRQK